jgi:transposase-like protein
MLMLPKLEVSLVIDPSPFLSLRSLEDLEKILSDGTFVYKDIFLPKLLHEALYSIIRNRSKLEELEEIFRGWLPISSREYSKYIIQGLIENENYVNKLALVFDKFKFRAYTEEKEKIGEDSVYFRYVVERLRNRTISKIIYDILSASQRGAWIITLSRKTIFLVGKIGTTVLTAPSEVKQTIKQNLQIRRVLNIASWSLAITGSILDLANFFRLPLLPLPASVGSLGILVVADG